MNERRVEFILKERRYSQTFYIEVSANGRFRFRRHRLGQRHRSLIVLHIALYAGMFGTGDDDMTGPNEHRYFTVGCCALARASAYLG